MQSPTEYLQDLYMDYCYKNGIPEVSADEQELHNLERVQRQWMFKFMHAWDAAQELERLG